MVSEESRNVVIIGAGVFSTETVCCLAEDDFKVTVLAKGKGIYWAGIYRS
jgi:predicted NAD/FAD-dependent oxidoreductase